MKKLTNLLIVTLAASASAADIDWSKLPVAATNQNVTFENDIAPLLKASCVRCHNANGAKAGLRLDTREGVLKGTKMGAILTAGDSANSPLVKSISQLDPETAMPPKPRGRRGPGGPGGEFGRPPGTNAPALQPREAGGAGGEMPRVGGGERPPGMPPGTNGPGRPRNFGPPAKPLTAEQVGLIRAWIDQGAK